MWSTDQALGSKKWKNKTIYTKAYSDGITSIYKKARPMRSSPLNNKQLLNHWTLSENTVSFSLKGKQSFSGTSLKIEDKEMKMFFAFRDTTGGNN